ncbi:MAG: DUF45 domain-containing protein [Bryobacterales bacterium]|nr:DUF45 domain-containing protein [Bryobacterales bacterium]
MRARERRSGAAAGHETPYTPHDGPEAIFRERFRRLKPRTETPTFEVRFRPYASLRSTIKMQPGSRTIQVNLSDMLRDAPADVLDSLAAMLLSKLYRQRIPKDARRRYELWTHTQAVQDRMLAVRRERGRKHVLPPAGIVHDLDALFDTLNLRHFAGRLRKPSLGWSLRASRRRLGHYDPAHDMIVISRIFDRARAPELALEYVLFHEMLHVKHPAELRGTRRCVHTPDFQAEERKFPGYERAKELLRSL